MNYPKLYCSKHGIARVPKHTGTRYDEFTGIPRLHYVAYKCPIFWDHLFDGGLIYHDIIDAPECKSYGINRLTEMMTEEWKK